MRVLMILIFGLFGQINAIDMNIKYPPSEMIMMDFSDDDDENVVLIEDNSSVGISIGDSISTDVSGFVSDENLKIALLVPKKIIGSHSNSVSNAIISYLIFKDTQFQFEVFDCVDEMEDSIAQSLAEIKAKGYSFVIAPMTQRGAEVLNLYVSDILVFIPTINRENIYQPNNSIIFGGLDYKRQLDVLLSYANEKIVLFGDGSRLSNELSDYIKLQTQENIVYEKEIKKIKTDLSFLKKNKKLKKSSIFLNMPIVKSSLLASQFRQYEVEPYVILSSQVNYNPLLFKLTQAKDREFFYIANSISYYDKKLKDINLILGNNPDYNWIDYSTSIGIDYVFRRNSLDADTIFDEEIYDNQIEYKVRIEKAAEASFEPLRDGSFNY